MRGIASLSSVGRAPDCSCVKTNVSADIRVSPVQVWERGLFLQPYGTSPLNREVERFHLLPLSWERGPTTSHQLQRRSTHTREVERLVLQPLSWERGPHLQRSASAWFTQTREAGVDLLSSIFPTQLNGAVEHKGRWLDAKLASREWNRILRIHCCLNTVWNTAFEPLPNFVVFVDE